MKEKFVFFFQNYSEDYGKFSVESRRQDEAHYTALRSDASGNGANTFSVESPLFAQQNQIRKTILLLDLKKRTEEPQT